METVTYEVGKGLIAGDVITDQVPIAVDTYYTGMPLEYDATANAYKYLDAGTIAGIYNGVDARVVAVASRADVILWGELLESGLRDDAGDVLTLDDDARALYRASGLFVKEQ